MKFGWRLVGIALLPIIALVVIVVGRTYFHLLDTEAVEAVTQAHRWLAGIVVLYLVNYLLAWRFAESWRISMSRMLVFGLIAYLCISNIIDIFGMNDSLWRQILGSEPPEDAGVVVSIRLRISA